VLSRKCVGSLLVTVIVSVEGGGACKVMLSGVMKLLPTNAGLTVIAAAVTVAVICVGYVAVVDAT
jgi:hypothetical protein